VVANCRICLAEVWAPNPRNENKLEPIPKLLPTCQTPAGDGQVIYTDSPKAIANQKAVMEYLLINHPLDCPVCDQAGECYLQDYSYRYGRGYSRFEEAKVKQPKKDIGPHVLLYSDRCIMCSRCVRFTREITGTGELCVTGRGNREEIDLFPGKAMELANKLYESLHGKLLTLPDFCEVYPAHGAGSLCGRAMGAKRATTIGYERKYNAVLQITDKDEFIKSLTTNMPAAPDHFSRCSAINGKGPVPVRDLPVLTPLGPSQFQKAVMKKNTIVLDSRSYEAFGGQHVPGSYHVDFGGNFATFSGWVLPPDRNILLVAESFAQAQEAGVWLKRVGLDKAIGYLDGGMFAWAKAGLPTNHVPQLSAEEIHQVMTKGGRLTLLDVRAVQEFQTRHIEGATNIPAPDLRHPYKEIDKKRPVALICSTGHRSSLGAALLKQRGFEDVRNVAGGIMGYSAAGYSEECPLCSAPHIPAVAYK
jgi:rhodanese-related sulfurtransferase